MDTPIDSQTTKKLSKTQLLIREALKSAPPLTVSQKTIKDFVVLEDNKKFDENSLFGRFLKHKKVTEKKVEDNNNGFKWWELKNKLTQEMENKRIESEKFKEINEKFENEDIEEVDEDIDESDDTFENNRIEPSQKRETERQSDPESDQEYDEEDEAENSDADEEDNSDDQEEEEEEEEDESDREKNPFVNDEADEDEEEEHNRQPKKRQSLDEESKCEDLSENSNSSHLMDNSFEENETHMKVVCVTQKIAVSPFISQKPKSVFNENPKISELIPSLDINNEEFNSQSLVELCSGNFDENNCKELENEDKDKSEDNPKHEENESDDEIVSEHKKNRKVFNIESEDESESDGQKFDTQSVVSSLKRFNESDGEDLLVTESEQSEEENEAEEEEETNIQSFFDGEAELSGSDASSDEEEDDEDGQQEEEEEQEDLPSDSELKDQIGRIHHKRMIDEDKRELLIMKEMMFEDGDLHEDGGQRQRKFRWKFNGDDNFVNDYINEDSDDNYMDSDEDEKTKTPVLKMFDKSGETSDHRLDKLKSRLKNSFELKDINKNLRIESKAGVNSLSAFVVRDQRLKTVMSVGDKRRLSDDNGFKSSKRFKDSKKNKKTSVFDLLMD